MKIIICTGLLFSTSFVFAQSASPAETNEVPPKPQKVELNSEPVPIPQPPAYIYETHKAPQGREEEVRKAEEKAYQRPVPEFPPVISSPGETGILPNDTQ